MQLSTIYGYKADYGAPMCCCGATYADPKEPLKTIRSAGKGIRVIYGIHAKPDKHKNIEIAHVATKNGDLTIVTKHQ